MSWATEIIKVLGSHRDVEFRPRGHSMEPKIKSGQLVRIQPVVNSRVLNVGDIVLCRVKNRDYLHQIIRTGNGLFLIGNNKGRTNGWIHRANIFGICTELK